MTILGSGFKLTSHAAHVSGRINKYCFSTHPTRRRRTQASLALGVAAAASFVYVSYETRKWRRREQDKLPVLTQEIWHEQYPQRSWDSVIETVQRMGLMGSERSVRAELERIRSWHQQRGFKGGLVVRDLTRPVFGFGTHDDDDDDDEMDIDERNLPPPSHNDWTLQELLQDPTRLERRECYYLYYEVEPNGQVIQQIFCRGTTLGFDVLTCIQAWTVYDPDLECWVHRGFRNQANRILKDVLPLLAPPWDRRATVELCGHSLGGAVASILAVKLKKLGYRVKRLTTVGEPRFLKSTQDAKIIVNLLPADQLRIEHDRDFVTFLPPTGAHLGNKLWLSSDHIEPSAYFIPNHQLSWTDSVWINFRAWEILTAGDKPHRVRNYVEHLSGVL